MKGAVTMIKQWLLYLFVSVFVVVAYADDNNNNVKETHSDEKEKITFLEGDMEGDQYVAGGHVISKANTNGDLVVAAGRMLIENAIANDLIAAGGNVKVSAEIGDDARIAGGQVIVSSKVKGDSLVAGGRVEFTSESSIANRVWVAAGTVEFNGIAAKGLNIKAGQIIIGGKVTGDLDLYAKTIEILPSARIKGNINYSSSQEIIVHESSSIEGSITRTEVSRWQSSDQEKLRYAGLSFFLVFFVSLFITAAVLYLLMPSLAVRLSDTIQKNYLSSIALGLIALLFIPAIILLLAITVIGLPLSLITLFIYILLLIAAYFIGLFFLADKLLKYFRQHEESTRRWRLFSILVALILLLIIAMLPFIGGLLIFFILLMGIGSIVLYAKHYCQ